ncbi:MAG: metallopeptidase family protein [Polyangiales bacterium]
MTPPREQHRLIGVDGSVLTVELVPGPPIDDDRVQGRLLFAGRMWNAVAAGRLHTSRPLDALSVADFHLVRDLAERRGVLAYDEAPETCRNCGGDVPVDRRNSSLETLLARAPDDRPPEAPFELATPVGKVCRVDQRPVDVAKAKALFRFAANPSAPFDAKVVRALGVRALETPRGRVNDPGRIAHRLAEDDALFAVVEALYLELNYPPRLRIPAFCPSCGAICNAPTPSTREVCEDPDAFDRVTGVVRVTDASFPSYDAFISRAEELATEVFAARHVAHLELVVVGGVPHVDVGGEPLLGSYEPIEADDGARMRFVVSLYYRTFASQWADAPYDVDAEIREVLDHEVEHHLHHLRGHDPLDEEERREAYAELQRTFGPQTVRKAESDALRGELRVMGRFFFWGALLCAALLAGATALGLVDW